MWKNLEFTRKTLVGELCFLILIFLFPKTASDMIAYKKKLDMLNPCSKDCLLYLAVTHLLYSISTRKRAQSLTVRGDIDSPSLLLCHLLLCDGLFFVVVFLSK